MLFHRCFSYNGDEPTKINFNVSKYSKINATTHPNTYRVDEPSTHTYI